MRVLLSHRSGSLGDNLGASPYYEIYRQKTGHDVIVSTPYLSLFEKEYPQIKFFMTDPDPSQYDQRINLCYFFDKPLQKCYTDQLGLLFDEVRPKVTLSSQPRPIAQKYVCIGPHSTSQSKCWNYPNAWEVFTKNLMEKGLSVVSLSKYPTFGGKGHFNPLPPSAMKVIGKDLPEVIGWLQHAEFFVGLPSGLSWLAHAVGKHVVMISGISYDWCEFTKDITRISNTEVCHGCFNDPKRGFRGDDWLWCPSHQNTPRHFECTKTISPDTVISRIQPLLLK